MEATIYGENEEVTGVRVVDNNDVEHEIEVERDGEIYSHHQDGYPDLAAERTPEEDRHVAESRRFARHYVYQERGYDTLPNHRTPDRISGVLLAIQSMSIEQFEDFFGDLNDQLASHEDESVERPVPLSREAENARHVVYFQGVYLRQDLDELREIVSDRMSELAEELLTFFDGIELTDLSVSNVYEAISPSQNVDFSPDLGIEGVDIESVSEIYVRYQTSDGWKTLGEKEPFEREPDAVIQYDPPWSSDIETFRFVLTHHLMCQLRDFYISIGVEPPEAYRIVGRGMWEYTTKYNNKDIYENYHDYTADIDGYYSMF